MDEQLFEMLRDMKSELHEDIIDIKKSLKEHVDQDTRYWRKIDVQEGQITLIKVFFGSGTFMGLVYGLWQWINSKVGIH